jgi:SAM-dependent methyltransferase
MCGGSQLRWFDTDYLGVEIYRCTRCAAAFSNPQPTDEQLSHLYTNYKGLGGPEEGEDGSAMKKARRQRKKRPSGNICHNYNFTLIERFVSPGRVLSVGCGNGTDLLVARARGWEAEGLEIDEVRGAHTAERTGCEVKVGNFLDLAPEDPGFQCVYLNHVLEHPREPGAFLRKAHALLNPSGVLWVACPNISSLANRLKTSAGRLGLKKRRGKHYACWHHLFFFTPAMLVSLLQDQYAFDVVHVQGELRPKTPDVSSLRERAFRVFPNLKSSFQLIARKR